MIISVIVGELVLKVVKCRKCGMEYMMPDLGVEVTMDDCPVCKEVAESLKKMGL